jgi:hypothetical protein
MQILSRLLLNFDQCAAQFNTQHGYHIKSFSVLFIKEGKESGGLGRNRSCIVTEGRKLPALKFPMLFPLLLIVKVN